MTQNKLSLAQQLSRFEAVFCSGFVIPDPAIVTALSLLFERVYFPNNLEFVIDFAQHYQFEIPQSESASIPEVSLKPINGSAIDALSGLNCLQRKTAEIYLFLADSFCFRNALLFPNVFCSTLFPKGEVLSVELIKKKVEGKKHLYRVSKNPMRVTREGPDELERYIREGKVPILSNVIVHKRKPSNPQVSASQIATALALQSIIMVLPATQRAEAKVILEARERLRNHLPPFWSAMLKLSVELQKKLDEHSAPKTLQRECDNAVSTIIRPTLIDLANKLEKERKLWFHKILSPVRTVLGVLAGKPPIGPFELATTSLKLGTDIALDISSQVQKVEAMNREIGLTYLIELHKVLSKKALKSMRK